MGLCVRVATCAEVAKLTSSMTVEQMQARLAQLQAEVRRCRDPHPLYAP